MWDEGIELAKTAHALDEALEGGDSGRIIELAELLSQQVKNEVSSRAEAEGWYEEYDRATSAEHWQVETKVVPAEKEAVPDRPLQRLRREAGFRTAADFAMAAGIPIGAYTRYERGQVDDIPPGNALDIAKRLADSGVQVPSWLSARAEYALPHDPYPNEHLEPAEEVPTVSWDGYPHTLALYLDRDLLNGTLGLGVIDASEDSKYFGRRQRAGLTFVPPNDPVAESWCAEDGHIILQTPSKLTDALVDAGIVELTGKFVYDGPKIARRPHPLAIITPEAMSNLRGFRETADRLLAERQEAEPQQGHEQGWDDSVSLKSEAEAMRESANQLAGGDTSLKPDPER